MTNRTSFVLLALLAVVLAGCSVSPRYAEAELIAVQNRYITAVRNDNHAELEKLLAPDYVSVSATGGISDRTEVIGAPPGAFPKAAVSDMKVRFYGQTAVVVGRYEQLEAGGTWSGRFTAVWVRHGGSWQVVSEHYSKLTATDAEHTQ
jgi:uncharacterized lipoprotein